jgi:putative two-component system response regulator
MLDTYYLAAFIISVVLTGIYMFIWNKHYDVHITLLFALVPVVNLGFLLYSRANSLEEAIMANEIAYIGGCYLQLMIMLAVFSLCHIHLNRWIRIAFFTLSTVVFLSTLTQGSLGLFYRSVSFVRENGRAVLQKEYGPMHHVFLGMVVLYFVLSWSAIFYALAKKKQVSRKILILMFLPEVVGMVCYFGGRLILPGVELMPAAYVFAQIVYLIIVRRIGLYDVTDITVDTLVQSGETGFIIFDFGHHYLGSNHTARSIFPGLDEMTVDYSVRRYRRMKDRFVPWLEAFAEDPSHSRHLYKSGDKTYEINISWLYNGKRRKGYELVITDDTLDQNQIRLLDALVEEKTEHIVEMHNQLILGMATMVESRDNSTGGHIRRTSEGVKILIDQLKKDRSRKLDDGFCKKLIKAAPMHDLGKIAVDDEILRKPGRFTPEEFEKMKAHAPEGARIVHEILKNTDDEEFKMIAENVAHYHHERWDGTGYPDGLKGEEIPLEARIMAIADVYDALVSKRVYKEKMPFDKANEIIESGMGTQFDPSLQNAYRAARPHLEKYYATLE